MTPETGLARPAVPVLGVPLSPTSYQAVLAAIETRPRDRALVVAFCNVHSVMSARRDPQLASCLAGAELATTDGMPLVWALRRLGHPRQGRVYGPDLMEEALRHGVPRGWRHFLFGATDATLDRLVVAVERIAPGTQVVGRFAPPFRPLGPEDDAEAIARIRAARPDIVWVGLGMPKQELWMHRVRDRLPGVALMGVGAAFDLLSGTVPQAPDWMQERGLEWAYRLRQEPRRLWRRYLLNNPLFAVLVVGQLMRAGRNRR